jgi:trimethylamine--corrinoid protein Co-methyltransferase
MTVSLLQASDLELLHASVLEVLGQTGVRFESRNARRLLEEAGCQVDEDSRVVRFSSDLVDWAISKLRRKVLLAGRDPEKDVMLDGSRTAVVPAGICPYMFDESMRGQRFATLDDLSELGRVCDALDEIGALWYPVIPDAVDSGDATDLVTLACLLANTGKHIQGQLVRPEDVVVALELLRLVAPEDDLRGRPIFSSLYCPVSPLIHEAANTDAGMAMVAAGIPLLIITLPLAGATAPATLAGAMVQNMAETLSAVVLFKLVDEDCPLVLAGTTALIDFGTGEFATSVPEIALLNVAHVEWIHSYGAPAMSVGFPTDSYGYGHKMGAEAMGYGLLTHLSRPDMMLGPGNMAAGTVMSLRKLVFDCELLRYGDRLRQGLVVDAEHAQLAAIDEVGPGGNHLERLETLDTVRAGEVWRPELLRRTSYEEWSGYAADPMGAAGAKAEEILATHRPMSLPEPARAGIREHLLRARPEARAVVERL